MDNNPLKSYYSSTNMQNRQVYPKSKKINYGTPPSTSPFAELPQKKQVKWKPWLIAIIAFLILLIPAYNIQKTNREGDYVRARVILKTINWGQEWIHSQNGFTPIETFLETHVKMPAGEDLYPYSYTKPENLTVKDFSDQDSSPYTVVEVTAKSSEHYKKVIIKPEYTSDALGSEEKTWISLKYDDFSRENNFQQYGGFACLYVAIIFVLFASGLVKHRRRNSGFFSTPMNYVFDSLTDVRGFSNNSGGRRF